VRRGSVHVFNGGEARDRIERAKHCPHLLNRGFDDSGIEERGVIAHFYFCDREHPK
jgi:hypothetical protein